MMHNVWALEDSRARRTIDLARIKEIAVQHREDHDWPAELEEDLVEYHEEPEPFWLDDDDPYDQVDFEAEPEDDDAAQDERDAYYSSASQIGWRWT